jgi:hypothetical protein
LARKIPFWSRVTIDPHSSAELVDGWHGSSNKSTLKYDNYIAMALKHLHGSGKHVEHQDEGHYGTECAYPSARG